MALKRLQDIPLKLPRIRQNREDPKEGEGPFMSCVSATRDAELVTPNGLVWNDKHEGYVETEPTTNKYAPTSAKTRGNRASETVFGGYNIVNGYRGATARRRGIGNESGE